MFMDIAQNWWALAIRGIAAIVFGIIAFAWPGLTLIVLLTVFAAYAIINGAFAVITFVNASRTGERWWALLLEGLVGIAVGIFALVIPGITTIFLLYVIVFWALVTGIFEIITAVRIREMITNEWLMVLTGIASIIFGVLLLAFPDAGALALVWLIGAYAIIFGILELSLAGWFRKRGREPLASAR